MNRLRFWTVALLLTGVVVLLYARPSRDRIPAREPLAQFPTMITGWMSTDLPIDQETRDVLGDGDFLSRNYVRQGAPAGFAHIRAKLGHYGANAFGGK